MKLPREQAKEFNKVNFPVVKATAGCILIKDNKVLLTKRKVRIENDKWCIPGGHMDIGETPEETVRRETKEETGLNIKNLKFLSYENEFMPELKNHSLVLMFQGTPEGKESNNDEVSEQKWFTKEEALKLDLAFNHKDILIKYFNKTK